MASPLKQKGHKKLGGRTKGTPNKYSSVRDTVLKVFNDLQTDPKVNLTKFAQSNPKDFYLIASRLIPTEVTATVNDITVRTFNLTPPKVGS